MVLCIYHSVGCKTLFWREKHPFTRGPNPGREHQRKKMLLKNGTPLKPLTHPFQKPTDILRRNSLLRPPRTHPPNHHPAHSPPQPQHHHQQRILQHPTTKQGHKVSVFCSGTVLGWTPLSVFS